MGTKLKNQERVVCHNIMKLATVKKFMPVEVLPLVGAVTTGVCLSAYALRHHAVYNPDISTKSRTTYGWERFESAQKIEPRPHFLEGTTQQQSPRIRRGRGGQGPHFRRITRILPR